MKSTSSILTSFLGNKFQQRNLRVLFWLMAIFVVLLVGFSTVFHILMEREGQSHSWPTAIYWTFVVMSTLGFGDITFQSDLGRIFSVIVLLSGTIFLLVLLPFTFIQFFFLPWMEARQAARAPTSVSSLTRDHVILTKLDSIERALIRMLEQSHVDYVVLVDELPDALSLHDQGFRVMVGPFDDPETYRMAGVDRAALVVANRSDTANTNIAFTVREIAEKVPIVATASFPASVDILDLAGCTRVLQMGEMLGNAIARRVLGRDSKCHVIGEFGDLLVADASASGTPLVGRSLRQIGLRSHANVNVIGLWQRGKFQIATPDTVVQEHSVLVFAGSREQLDQYDALFCIYKSNDKPVIIIGGGRVGRSVGESLARQGIDYRIVERQSQRIRNPEHYVLGDAAELEVLVRAGIEDCSSVVITTHDDDMNVYLTLYCRRLRPDVQILARSNVERNVSTLHRAGADFVLSYATTGANALFNLLRRSDVLLLAEGLHVFRLPTPDRLQSKTLLESGIRETTGCSVVAVVRSGVTEMNPDAKLPLMPESELVVIGDAEAETRFRSAFT
ncbi:MAG TPA: potassium transporter TrkA [Planctomycetaceae bacterium]|nr:potassium transporter TrkA [Planctomycetaceae bacterium]